MGASSEYYLRLQEEEFNALDIDEQSFLMHLGMQVRQLETQHEENDEFYKKIKTNRIKAWNDEQEYLFKKRQKVPNEDKPLF